MLKQPSVWIGGDFVTDDEFFRRNEVRASLLTSAMIVHIAGDLIPAGDTHAFVELSCTLFSNILKCLEAHDALNADTN